ncbi:uncharacterized protein LOC134754057 [Cydia strobilella]|uniref:uncharacterized protein LOC134754057 n=1 Tax=Cydia strobilella TaxID=1100964 RepID=UPI0030056306
MDWWKLFAVLVAVACVHVSADGPKKKIRIHLPQKVKHIHHHKKIYITQHPAQSQYAPAYLPNAEGAVAVPMNVALPSVASIVPLDSEELFEESHNRLPGVAAAASKLLPLYRARGYYGPNHSEVEEQDYDLDPPPEPEDSYLPSAFSAPAATAASTPKRVKVLKVNETPRKKIKKVKPKRIVTVRNRPQPEEEHPVSSFHEQFYSDVAGSGTIKKIRRPQRVEKIIDGDTEHIHTYSEEHIHKVVFDDRPKLTGVVGLHGAHGPRDHLASMSALAAHHPLIPLKNSHSLLALSSDPFTGLTAVGSMGTPSHLEYAAYNPRDVTHDHIFHDHGEITSDIDVIKDSLGSPPKGSYNSQGLRISGSAPKRHKYGTQKYSKPTKPSASTDFSYYEGIYSPHSRPKKVPKPTPTTPTPHYETSSEVNYGDYRRIPSFKVKDKSKLKSRYVTPNPYYGDDKLADYRLQQASVPAPFSLSSTVVHDYKPGSYDSSASAQTQTGFTNFKDPFVDFKGYSNNFDYDTYASPSNVQASENKDRAAARNKNKNKSISTQNISFGGHTQHQSVLDHLEDPNSSGSGVTLEDDTPTSAEINAAFDNFKSTDIPTAYTIKETSPVHQYYSAMAIKALHGDPLSAPAASNDNFQYAEPPTPSTTSQPSSVATTTGSTLRFYRIQSTDTAATPTTEHHPGTKQSIRTREKKRLQSVAATKAEPSHRFSVLKEFTSTDKSSGRSVLPTSLRHLHRFTNEHPTDSSTVRGKLKYGDKI